MIPIRERRQRYEFINLTLWWFKVPEVVSTIVTIVGAVGFAIGALPIQIFFCGFWYRIAMVPIRLIFVNMKRNLEKDMPSLLRTQKYDAYRALQLSYLRTEKWIIDTFSKIFK